jgi:hypothetical protein
MAKKRKKRLFLSNNDLSWAKNQKSYLKYGHLFADIGLLYCKLSVWNINQFIEDHKYMVLIGQRPKNDQ